MKRCPQCEFLYEDDQRLCDMDGQALIHDQKLSDGPSQPLRRSHLKNFVAPALAGLLLAGILSVTYYAAFTSVRARNAAAINAQSSSKQFDINSKIQPPSQSSIVSAGSASAMPSTPSASPAPTTAEIESTQTAPSDKTSRAHVARPDPRLVIPRGVAPLPRLKPLPTLPDAQPLKNQNPKSTPRDKPAPPKKDSKLTSVLKKTGRALSRPFKL